MRHHRPAWSLMLLLVAGTVVAYPLEGGHLGIRRLAGEVTRGSGALSPGALLSSEEIVLHLAEGNPTWDLSEATQDSALSAALTSMLARRDPSYAVTVIDITDPQNIVWAGLRDGRRQFPGSVGKVLSLLGFFDALSRAFPQVDDRERILRTVEVTADDWAMGDTHHKVPTYDATTGRNRYASVQHGDRFTLAEWLDHMISASANAAGTVVWKETLLLREFGAAYPPSPEAADGFFRTTSKTELQRRSQQMIDEPLAAAGIDLENIQQGTIWTRPAQARIPGLPSFATPRELARVLLRVEQGQIVDPWTCLEIKRFLYTTRPRYRFVYAPELRNAAVYFKSGSFYKCAEPRSECGKYKGNDTNIMNSVAIVESPGRATAERRVYIAALTSNVLKVNSAWDHSRLAVAIEEALRSRRAVEIRTDGSAADIDAAGRS